MPIYAYQCQGCGHKLEKIQRLSDAPLTDCPVCNQTSLKKQITAASFKLTGTGWYETDFKNKSTDKSKSSDKSVPETKSADTAAESKKSDKKDSKKEIKHKSTKDAA